jgi:hypothetical protein
MGALTELAERIDGHLMTDPGEVRQYALAGHATLTLRSQRTGSHYTYRVDRATDDAGEPQDRWFVKVLTDGDQYTYMGVMDGDLFPRFRLTKSSRLTASSFAVRAWTYFWEHLEGGELAPCLEVRHHNHCGRCGRELTHPESIDRGIGPDCWEMMHG